MKSRKRRIGLIILSLILAVALGAMPVTALPPMFMADKTEVVISEPVTFTNMFSLGTPPYTKAEWDFDGDGVFEITIVGASAEVMVDVVWVYYSQGVYSVTLQMTDSTPMTYWEEKVDYITVLFDRPWSYDTDGDGVISKAEALVALADYFGGDITKAQALEVIALYFG